jgi:HK97 family phage major capsid protein
MKSQRTIFAVVLVGLALASAGAQAMGVDVSAFMLSHADIIGGLSLVGFAGEIAVNDPAAIKAALDKISDQVKEKGEAALAEAKKGHDISQKAKEATDELLIKLNGLQAELREVEQKQAARAAEPQRVKSYGEQIVESDLYKNLMAKGGRGTISMDLKQVTSTAAGGLIRPLYETDIVALPQRRFTIRDLLPVIPIATSSVDYPKQASRTNNAATVAEAAAKPYSDYAWTNATAPVRVIAHLAKLTRQAMDDAPRLVGEVDAEMRYGLGLVEEAQILNGNGTGQNLSGIMTQATAYVAPFVISGATSLDMLRLAMLQAAMALYPADGIVLSQLDWARIQLQKTTDGAYLFANPQGTVEARLWGLPVVDTPAMPVDAFLVGAFRFGATLYDRMGVEILISTENADDFEKNLATMRAEERIALAVKRPGSFIVGDFGLVA